MKNEHGVTQQQEKFCRAVVAGKSQADAYREAYKVRPGTKAKSVHEKASALAASVKVRSRLASMAQEVHADFTVETSDLLRESFRLATSDVSRIVGEGGKVLLPHELDEDTRRAIASFEIDDMGRIKYKFWDKNSALERLFKYRGLFATDNAQQNPPAIYQIALVALQPEKKAE